MRLLSRAILLSLALAGCGPLPDGTVRGDPPAPDGQRPTAASIAPYHPAEPREAIADQYLVLVRPSHTDLASVAEALIAEHGAELVHILE